MSEATTAERHWRQFVEFCQYELATGGPDPHARYVGILSQKISWHDAAGWKERVWRGGLYSAVYTAPTAEALWRAWPYERVAESSQGGLLEWLKTHWAGLPLRRERRAVRTPEKLARCLWSYVQWMEYGLPPTLKNLGLHAPEAERVKVDPYEAYSSLWLTAEKQLYGFGRYALTKLLDFYEHYCDILIKMPDIRPNGGWSPRATLGLLFPSLTYHAPDNNSQGALNNINFVAKVGKAQLENELWAEVDWFRYEVLLCEYRQSVERQRQYPGRSIDSELKYLHAVEHYWNAYTQNAKPWDYISDIWQVRQNMHPHECLGELNGWDGVRDDLGGFLNQTGHTWSDLLWDYTVASGTTKAFGVTMAEAGVGSPWTEKEGGRERIRILAQAQLKGDVATSRSGQNTLV